MHSDKIKLRRFAMQLYFAGDVKRYAFIAQRLAYFTSHGVETENAQCVYFGSSQKCVLISGQNMR